MLPTGKNHVSYSELKNWSECSWRHDLLYIKKIDMFVPNVHVAIGTATHNAIESFLRTKEMDPSIARTYMTKYIDENTSHEKFVPYVVNDEMKKIESMLRDVPTFLDETYPGWEMFSAEEALQESVKEHINDHADVTFKGFIDCVISTPIKTKKEEKKQYHILDWKTSNRSWGKFKLSDPNIPLQLRLYKKFWATKHSIAEKDVKCSFVVLIKTAKPGNHCQKIDVSYGDVTSKRSLDIIDNMVTSVKNGIKIKNRSSCRWCPFFETSHCP
jgi:hypothetical protein